MTTRLPPVLCIVGRKNSGKTELTVALGAELTRRGYRVMTAKHGHGFHLDRPGKDSWRHRHEGGAHRTVLAGPSDFGVVGHWPSGEMPLSHLVERFLWDADVVLAEGFKGDPAPKIEVFRGDQRSEPLLAGGEEWTSRIVALVTDAKGLEAGVPVFRLDDSDLARSLADFIQERFLAGGEGP